jgi:hypothetical protein
VRPVRLLLGPQRPTLNLGEAIAAAGLPEGRLAVISAGWQEAEGDLDDVREVVGRPLTDLRLHQRAEEVFAAESQLATAYRTRQDTLQEQQRLYRLRLTQLAIAARQILGADGDRDLLAAEQRHAIAQLRALDRHHLHRTETVHGRFDESCNITTNTLLAKHATEIREVLDSSSAVLITGGNIVVLLNRMRLFGVEKLLRDKHVIAWSAGAMVLAERIVLYHDRAPQGRRDPEILGAGCGLLPGYVFLPDTERRLREDDRVHIGLMCRRFSPDLCVTLDSGAALKLADARIEDPGGAQRFNRNGRLRRLRAS